jgi:hypothetical protein
VSGVVGRHSRTLAQAKVVIQGKLPMRVYTNHDNEHSLHGALQIGSRDGSHATDERDTAPRLLSAATTSSVGLIHEYQRAA